MAGFDRRSFLTMGLGAVVGVGVLPLAACSKSSTVPPTVSPRFRSPEDISSVDGVLETTLTAIAAMVPFGDGTRWAYTYGGSTPGPTLRARPGDLLRIRVVNRLDTPTNLHTHGLHVSPEGNSDNVFVSIDAGGEFLFEIQLPTDHRGGTYWYHPHRHGFVAEQVAGGMAGVIIIEDRSDQDPLLSTAIERVMVLGDPRIGSDSGVVTASRADRMSGREGDLVTVNGVHQPVISGSTGTVERWRLVNASSSRYYRLVLDGAPMMLAGTDGGLIEVPEQIDHLLMTPGERAEFLVAVSDPGTITLRTTPYDRGGSGMGGGRGGSDGAGTIDLLTLDASGPSTRASLPTRIEGARIADPPTATGSRSLELSMGGGGGGGAMSFMIDGRTFDPERIDTRLDLGAVEEWTVSNASNMDHPFHIHIWQFRVVDASDESLISPGLKDTVNIPAGGWVKFILEITDFPGKSVYHCHILDHEDQGMMGVFETTA